MSYSRNSKTPDGYSQQPNGRATLYNQTYVGFVRKVEDELRMGRLAVWIPDLGGDSEDEKSWYTVNYCSPFAGATDIDTNTVGGTKMHESQRSYGFWAVPPDRDNEVIVMFINGDPNKGIWIGSLYKQYMNHMVPGIPHNRSHDPGPDEAMPPVVEYNKKDSIGNNDDPIRPRFDPLHLGLTAQGLYKDFQRGPASSGARRESPSKVFGMLSPRGNQMYIDDLECNEFIRLRTRSGVQLLIHETDGYIYMNSKQGNSWMQISDDGIDMYSSKGVNIHSTGGYQFHTDKDYNLHIGGSFNVFTEGDFKVSTAGNVDMLAGKDMKQDVGGAFHSTIKSNRTVKVEGGDSVDVSGKQAVRSGGAMAYTAGGNMNMQAPMIYQNSGAGPQPEGPAEAAGAEPAAMPDRKLQESYPEDERDSITARMPTHEPWVDHRNHEEEGSSNGGESGGGETTEPTPGNPEGGVPPSNPSGGKANWQGYRDNVNPKLQNVVDGTASDLDFPVTVTSGFRDPGKNAAVGGASGSSHQSGNAVDIRTKNLTTTQKSQLVNSLINNGATRINFETGNNGGTGEHLHVDMATGYTPPPGYRAYPMYEWSARNMNSAPGWFRDAMSGGGGTSGSSGGGGANLNSLGVNPMASSGQFDMQIAPSNTVGRILVEGSAGSAVVVDFSGTLMTAAHVVGLDATKGSRYRVDINGEARVAELLHLHPARDIAQLRVIGDVSRLEPAVMGGKLKAGEPLMAWGYAGGNALTVVECEYTGEAETITEYAGFDDTSGLQVYGLGSMRTTSSDSIYPGMSGGPVFDSNNRLVGLNASASAGSNRVKFIKV